MTMTPAEGDRALTVPEGGRERRRPWHLWAFAVVTFALYVGGARDFLLILADDTEYMLRQFGPDGVAYFADYPLSLRIVWTVNVVGGLAAPILLLALDRWAAWVAVVAAASQLVLLMVTFAFRDRWDALGATTSLFDIGIGVVTVFFAWYCWRIRRSG
ncbi:hypothetical protein [Micromonospora sp. KC213]|uniref:hypothetical protein n=1 Tax=Micromonospora sp. KC213 TaxID=2530378 RepID=UPI001052E813|nr:hypothetical protein [Micromonospora sp. KC213]TDC40992.1 hypothetical protein E1166_13445 [Micromonospora sp. KC213]